MTDFDTPVTLDGHWVLVTPEETAGTTVTFHVSIGVGDPETLTAGDLSVTLTAAGTALTASEAPVDGPLPVVESRGITAFAQYAFDNPDQAGPLVLTVGLGGETADFELTGAPNA